MKKSDEKRGRPGIKPYIKEIIASRILDELKKPQEARMPRNILAFEIQKDIKQIGEQSPKQSTLEKLISAYSKRKEFTPEDEVWSLYSYYWKELRQLSREYEVPPEALPTVLQVWLSARRDDWWPLSNREVKWVIRLYKVIDDINKLKQVARELALTELINELIGGDLLGYPSRLLTLIEHMTGQKFSEKEAREIISVPPISKDWWKKPAFQYSDVLRREATEKEAQNERKHKAKKQE